MSQGRVPEDDLQLVTSTVVQEGDGPGVHAPAVEGRVGDAAGATVRVGDVDRVTGRAEAPRDPVRGPRGRYAGIDLQGRAVAAEAQDALEAGAVHPARRAGVPRPAGAPGVGRVRMDV